MRALSSFCCSLKMVQCNSRGKSLRIVPVLLVFVTYQLHKPTKERVDEKDPAQEAITQQFAEILKPLEVATLDR